MNQEERFWLQSLTRGLRLKVRIQHLGVHELIAEVRIGISAIGMMSCNRTAL
jgi:hypothetical protein